MKMEQELQKIPQTPTYDSKDAGKDEVKMEENEEEDNIGYDEGMIQTYVQWVISPSWTVS